MGKETFLSGLQSSATIVSGLLVTKKMLHSRKHVTSSEHIRQASHHPRGKLDLACRLRTGTEPPRQQNCERSSRSVSRGLLAPS